MTNNTPKKDRFIKFATFECATYIGKFIIINLHHTLSSFPSPARPLSIYIGGLLLGTGNFEGTGNLHNYQNVFLFSLVCGIIQLAWVLIFIREDKKACEQSDDIEMKDVNQNYVEEDKSKHLRLTKIFDINNLRELYRTAVKVRPNRGRAQIWLLYLSMCCLMVTDIKSLSILFPYAERVYGWDAKYFSDIKSMFFICQLVGLPLASLILSKILRLNDSKLGIFGIVCYMLSGLCIASILNPTGLYLLFAVSGPANISSLALRSLLSKIASESESGRIFAVLGALEQIFPSFEALVLNMMFKYTLDSYPSATFMFATAFNFIPLYIFFWIDITK